MAIRTFCGCEEHLEVINEIRPNLISLKEDDVDLSENVNNQKWENYFYLLKGPIFPTLVKEFWKFACISQDGNSIESYLYDFPISVPSSSIAEAIKCAQTGVTVDEFHHDYCLYEDLREIFHPVNSIPESNSPEGLLDITKHWYIVLINNIRPKKVDRNVVNHDDKVFLYLVLNKIRINLLQTIFNYLKNCVDNSRGQFKSYIPYGRILSALIFKEGLMEIFQRLGPSYAIEEEKFEEIEMKEDLWIY